MSPVVRAAGLEPAREPGLSRPPLPIGLRAQKHWLSGPIGLPTVHALRGELPIK